jgi:hypothetical protein
MKVGIAGIMGKRGTHFHSVHIQDAAPIEEYAHQEHDTPSPSWRNYLARVEERGVIRSRKRLLPDSPAMQRRQEARAARVEALRAQVQAGTYQVDSMAIAERLLEGYSRGYPAK